MQIWEWKIYKLYRKLNARNPYLRKLKIVDSKEINCSIIDGVKEAEEQRQEQVRAEKEYWIKRNVEFDRRLRQIEAKQAKERWEAERKEQKRKRKTAEKEKKKMESMETEKKKRPRMTIEAKLKIEAFRNRIRNEKLNG